ncbi:MAG: glycosyltransferase [Rhizobacter sp.]|nr:glycosyltransferase [Chlorobiales bacterium]
MSGTEIFFFITFFALALYVSETLLMLYGLTRKFPVHIFAEPPVVTVVVAARNEEHNIGRCLDSLTQLDYPPEKLDVIIADDHSTDRTAAIIQDYAGKFPFVRYHSVAATAIKGKGNAIDQAVHLAKGEFILMTDADCTVQSSWAKDILKYFTPRTGLICSTTLPRLSSAAMPLATRLFEKLQSLDWNYLLSMGSAMAGLGMPGGGIGNNFSFRKAVYMEVGGYEKVAFSVTEDFALFQAISSTSWKIAYPLEHETNNTTEPLVTLAELYKQKKRWILGGTEAKAKTMVTFVIGLVTHVATALAFFMLPLPVALAFFAVKMLTDLLFLLTPLSRLRSLELVVFVPLFELYYYLTLMIIPAMLLFDRKVVWKGRVYS